MQNIEFLVEEKKKTKLEDCIAIVGMPGMGSVGKLAIDFLIDGLDAKEIITIRSSHLPNCVFVETNNLVDLPKIEVFYKKIKNKSFIFVSGDIQPTEEESSYKLSENLISYLEKKGIKEIITVGGVGLDVAPKKPKLFISGTDKKILEKYKAKELKKGSTILGGPIVGMTGVLLGLSKVHKIPGIVILGEVAGVPSALGMRAAEEIVKFLNKKFTLGVNMKQINKEVTEIEKELADSTKEEDDEEKVNKKIKPMKIHENISYIG